tara:strand:- start:2238 stop:3191 length:954 start_codon:yes stop_codon:yes gene_type:complete
VNKENNKICKENILKKYNKYIYETINKSIKSESIKELIKRTKNYKYYLLFINNLVQKIENYLNYKEKYTEYINDIIIILYEINFTIKNWKNLYLIVKAWYEIYEILNKNIEKIISKRRLKIIKYLKLYCINEKEYNEQQTEKKRINYIKLNKAITLNNICGVYKYKDICKSSNQKINIINQILTNNNKDKISIGIIQLIIGKNPEQKLINEISKSIIHRACINNNNILIKVLIINNININIKEKDTNKLPIEIAIINKNVEICQLLIKTKAYINIKNQHTNLTPLQLAFKVKKGECSQDIIKILIKNKNNKENYYNK